MSHYRLRVPVEAELVKTIRTELDEFIRENGEVSVTVITDSGVDIPDKLQEALKLVFLRTLVSIVKDEFEDLH